MNFRWNPGAEDEIAHMAIAAIEQRFQPVLDEIHAEYSGRSVEEIKPVLEMRWAAANDGASITEPELTNVAHAFSQGTQVIMRDGRLEC